MTSNGVSRYFNNVLWSLKDFEEDETTPATDRGTSSANTKGRAKSIRSTTPYSKSIFPDIRLPKQISLISRGAWAFLLIGSFMFLNGVKTKT